MMLTIWKNIANEIQKTKKFFMTLLACGFEELLEDERDPDLYFLKARYHFGRQDFLRAIVAYSHALDCDPTYVDAYIERSYCFTHQDKYDRALKDLDQAIRIGGANLDLVQLRARVRYLLKQYEPAIEDYTTLIEQNPNPTNHYERGAAYEWIERYPEAIADYRESLRLDPSTAKIHLQLGHIYCKTEEFEKSIEEYSFVIEAEPSCGDAWLYRAVAYCELDQYDASLRDIEHAMELCQDNPTMWQTRGWNRYCLGDFIGSEEDMRRALAISLEEEKQQEEGSMLCLAGVLATTPCAASEEASRAGEALELAEKALASCKELKGWYHSILATALARVGRYDEAVTLQKKALEESNSNQKGTGKAKLKCFEEKRPFLFDSEKWLEGRELLEKTLN